MVKPTKDNNIVCGLVCLNQDILSMKFVDTLLGQPGFNWCFSFAPDVNKLFGAHGFISPGSLLYL